MSLYSTPLRRSKLINGFTSLFAYFSGMFFLVLMEKGSYLSDIVLSAGIRARGDKRQPDTAFRVAM